jgi:thiol-disulfide isomerase/thioredoxin
MRSGSSRSTHGLFYSGILLISLLLVFAVISPANQVETASPDAQVGEADASGFAPGLPWLNVSRPLTLSDLHGKVVILDFWTYGCINCIHVLADLKKLEQKYGHQLLVIGVHSPKFENEKNLETLRNIIVRYGIEHPVVNDVDFLLGERYGMRAWPTRVLIDPAGGMVGRITGEGRYELIDRVIGELLEEHREIVDSSPAPVALERDRLAASLLAAPGKIAVSSEYLAISDTLHNRIILADHQGKIKKIIGGPEAGNRDGDAASSRFAAPQGLVFSGQGLYIADTGNHLIRYWDIQKGVVSRVAGNGMLDRHRSGSFNALDVGLASPWGLAMAGGRLYIAMAGSHQIWRYDPATKRIEPYAGSGREGIENGSLKGATFSQPSGLSLMGEWLYIADAEDSAVRRIHLIDERVETVVGKGLFEFGDKDGSFDGARLQHVLGVAAVDPARLLIADTYNHKLKLLDLQQRRVSTLLGSGEPGSEVNESGVVQLNEPGGLALLGDRVLIADTNNHRILFYDLKTGRSGEWALTPESRSDPATD